MGAVQGDDGLAEGKGFEAGIAAGKVRRVENDVGIGEQVQNCLLYTSPSPRDS